MPLEIDWFTETKQVNEFGDSKSLMSDIKTVSV